MSKSFSGVQRPIIPKTFRHINVGGCENSRSYGDLASVVSNHSTERDVEFLNVKRLEFQRKGSVGVINGNYSFLNMKPYVHTYVVTIYILFIH